jgi:1,4-dihydroxy-6-naphthoate synthase
MNENLLTVAYSPCPNDTFMFHDIAVGELLLPEHITEIHIHDVETLNRMALSETFDITKLSIHAYLKVRDKYEMLKSGAALGFGCGPLIVARPDMNIDNISECRIAVPGELTTAHLLFRLWAPEARNIIFMPFDKIMDAVVNGEVDVGVVIHEGRFVYKDIGLECLADLGEWWQEKIDLPLPLGCIAAKRSLGHDTIESFDEMLKTSIENSLVTPEKTYDYVRQHAQELEESVFLRHINTFVNEFSIDMGPKGREAIEAMEDLVVKGGII